MKPSSVNKVFGIVSYFPSNDSEQHKITRKERTRRCSELLHKLEELWPDIDIIIIAQNWQDFEPPKIKNKIIRYDYDKLGIVGARKELRKQFLESDYDYLIMLDDDAMIECSDPSLYMNEIDKHPQGIGVIRHTGCSLMLLAISKSIYSKIDIPNIRAENGEGFEDDVFVARCFGQFPDAAFDFPKDCIKETSFKYTGPGECPSTWAREKKYDWNYMRRIDAALIAAASRKVESTDNDTKIDVVIPYVNSSDKQWMADYTKATGVYSASPVRFRSWDTLKYLFRSIEKNMPFVNRIILIVARESQVPIWIDTNTVRIVYHREFIPKEFLPTFNSCTIESFLYRIPDITEQFLYFNDDMFALNLLSLNDFFTNSKPHIKFLFHDSYDKSSIYRCQCRSGLDMITNALKLDRYPAGKLMCCEHTISPMLKSTLDEVGRLCEAVIKSTVSKLRMPKNVNQYIYSYYEYFTNNYIDDLYSYLYIDIRDDLSSIRYVILDSEIQVVCLNDSDRIKNYKQTRDELLDILHTKFPDKCNYEI